MGASLNAYTSREHTVYHAKVFKDDVAKGVDIISDIIQNSTLSEEHIERERGVILTEMHEVGKNTEEVSFDYLHSLAFQGSSLGYTILGPAKNIRSITRADLQDYIKTHYTADRMVIAAAGAVDHEQFVKLVEKHFAALPEKSSFNASSLPAVQYTGSAVTHHDALENVHVTLAVEGVSWSSPDYLPMMVIQNIVGNWSRDLGVGTNVSSRLCEVIANEGLATSIKSFNTCYNETGLFGAHAIAHPHTIEDLSCEILSEWVRLANRLTSAELERAKTKLRSSLLLSLDGNNAICEDIGRSILTLGRRQTPAELFKRIDDISLSVISRVAEKHFHDVDPVAVAIGDTYQFPDYNQLRGWTYVILSRSLSVSTMINLSPQRLLLLLLLLLL
jgi:mitochondrial-processing peptidase subunit beta